MFMPYMHRHTCFPVFPHMPPRLPLSHRLANLLVSTKVQAISFYFGHVHVLPEHFRTVADALRSGDITCKVDATYLATSGSDAEYDSEKNTFVFSSDNVLDTPSGRATAVHEASHAVADARKRGTAIRHEEAAAFVCEAWYFLENGANSGSDLETEFFDIASAMRTRAASGGKPVRALGSEINGGRRLAARRGYENEFYGNDGF